MMTYLKRCVTVAIFMVSASALWAYKDMHEADAVCGVLLPDSSTMAGALHAPWTADAVTVLDSVAVDAGKMYLYRLIYAGSDGLQAQIFATSRSALPVRDSSTLTWTELVGLDVNGENVVCSLHLVAEPVKTVTAADGQTQIQFTQTVTLNVDDAQYILVQVYYEYDVHPDGMIELACARPVRDDIADLRRNYTISVYDPDGGEDLPFDDAFIRRLLNTVLPPLRSAIRKNLL